MLEAEQSPEGGLDKEMKLRRYINESKARIICHFEQPLAEMNRRMGTIMAALAAFQRPDASVVNILREEHLEEEEGETFAIRVSRPLAKGSFTR